MGQPLICMSPWWNLAHVNPAMFKQVKLIIQLLVNKDRHNRSHPQCCDLAVKLSTHHILFECTSVSNTRNSTWKNMSQYVTPALLKCINEIIPTRYIPVMQKIHVILWANIFVLI